MEIKCTKCGAPVEVDAGEKFAKCKYCESQIFIDKSGVGFFYIMPFFVDGKNAEGIFRRWAAGSKMAKDLDKKAQVTQMVQQYFPVYLFKRDDNGKEKVFVEPSRSTTLPGLHSLKVPAGDIKIFDQKYDAGNIEMLKPDIEMGAYLPSLPGTSKEQALVYFPVWTIEYTFNGKPYGIVVDGSSGEAFAGEFPVRSSAPYFLIAASSFMLFFLEGMAGLGISLVFDWVGWAASAVLVLATMPVVLGAAYLTVRRF